MPAILVETQVAESRCVLAERLHVLLAELQPALRDDVIAALAVEGKILHQPASTLDGRWALLPFTLARDLQPDVDMDVASAVGLAVECVICSTDLLDDVMDGDVTALTQQLGTARTLNVALALLCLAQRVLLSLAGSSFSASLLMRLLEMLQRALLLATVGQQQDLLAEIRGACELSREECLAIAAGKAGTLLSLACYLGAICAGVEEARSMQCAEMGRLLGIAAQLDNDAHDLSHLLHPAGLATTGVGQKSDLVRGKKTLPIVLAAHSLHAAHAWDESRIDAALRNLSMLSQEERVICLAALHEGSVVTWGIALLYRERARDCLCELERDGPVSQTLRLILGLDETFPM
ncbi:MAG: polyprenyl synthetase family protein [Ktedonobacteraceae bacterium]